MKQEFREQNNQSEDVEHQIEYDEEQFGSSKAANRKFSLKGCLFLVVGGIVLLLMCGVLGSIFSPENGENEASQQPRKTALATKVLTTTSERTASDSPAVVSATPTLSPQLTSTRKNTATPEPTLESVKQFEVKVHVRSNANLRSGPGTNFDIVGTTIAGQELTVFSRTEDGWLNIDQEGDVWIGSSLVELDISLDSIPLPGELSPNLDSLADASISNTQSSSTPSPSATASASVTPSASPTPTSTPLPESAGLSEWLTYEDLYVGVQDLRWDYSLGYFRAERGKILVSLYIVALNKSDQQSYFSDSSFSLIDGGREETSGVVFSEVEPSFSSCSVLPGGKCEGWWTTMVWDRPEVRETLLFVWNPPCIFCPNLEAPITQE